MSRKTPSRPVCVCPHCKQPLPEVLDPVGLIMTELKKLKPRLTTEILLEDGKISCVDSSLSWQEPRTVAEAKAIAWDIACVSFAGDFED